MMTTSRVFGISPPPTTTAINQPAETQSVQEQTITDREFKLLIQSVDQFLADEITKDQLKSIRKLLNS